MVFHKLGKCCVYELIVFNNIVQRGEKNDIPVQKPNMSVQKEDMTFQRGNMSVQKDNMTDKKENMAGFIAAR